MRGPSAIAALAALVVLLTGCGPKLDMRDAIRFGAVQDVRKHLQRGYDPNSTDEKSYGEGHLLQTIAEHCARDDMFDARVQMAEMFLKVGAEVDGRNQFGETALFYAANVGCVELARLLVAQGADVNAKDRNNHTALHTAADRDRFEMCEVLIELGADVNAQDSEGRTPIVVAARGGDRWEEIVRLLLRGGADYTLGGPDGIVVNYTKIQPIAEAMGY